MLRKVLHNTALLILVLLTLPVAHAQTNGDAVIYPNSYQGRKVEHFYYDVKNGAAKVHDVTKANNLYVNDDMNGIRIPIYGNINEPAHPSAGTVLEAYYESIIKSVNFAKAARGDKDFYIFASKKLNGDDSYPAWTHNDNGIIVGEYVKLLTDFILFFKGKGIEIDFLGTQNEGDYTEAQLSPAEHAAIVDSLRVISVREGFKMPLIVGYEMYGPNKFNWVENLKNNGWLDRMDVYGTHYYPKWRPKNKLQNDLNLIGDMPFWSTEPHWDSKNDVDDWDEAEAGICAFWDQIDVGMDGFMWWAYSRSGGIRGNLMREISVPMLGATKIDMDDIDGRNIDNYGKLQTRAFREDSLITIYAVNNHTTMAYNNYGFSLSEGYIANTVSFTQYTKGSAAPTSSGNANQISNSKFSLSIPPQSVSIFSFVYTNTPSSYTNLNELNSVEVFPTMASEYLNIRGLQWGDKYTILNIAGDVIGTGTDPKIEISGYQQGMYFVQFANGVTKRFVKQ